MRTIGHGALRPPDLVIQDELHLISGPLGSLVGLYETAVDALCTWEVGGRRVRPKVIASTATIRNAPAQVRALFLRRLEVFPPPGTDVRSNFFAVQRTPGDAHPGRRYLGICAPGRRLKAALIRVYLAFLGAGQALYERHGRAADPWMTLVGYFNSMRELGGMRRLIDDDIRNRLRGLGERGFPSRRPPYVEELTSRKGSTEIPHVLDRLEIPFDPVDDTRRRALRQDGRPVDRPEPLDVLLATNMVSVGVDVKRLGLMVVCGQPKTTAEYIQATSRVGRSLPGVICTVYNWTRPRDLSHYERFEHYHATFYEQVESLSLTPFVLACNSGHLDDFPWVEYVHRGSTTCRAVLRLDEWGVSGEAADIEVRCDTCSARRRMSDAFGADAAGTLPACPGGHPHIRSQGACAKEPRAMLVGASNFWFPLSLSALSIPQGADPLDALVSDHWPTLREASSPEVLAAFLRTPALRLFAAWTAEQVWEAVHARRLREQAGPEAPRLVGPKAAEWTVLSSHAAAPVSADFRLVPAGPPPGYEALFADVVLAERLREVRALIGFTRIGSSGDYTDVLEMPEHRRAPLARRPPQWVPATEIRGEGIFIRLEETVLTRWLAAEATAAAEAELAEAHREWRARRHIVPPAANFPGMRYVLLHSLAHVLIRQVAIECGYGAASIRERIYASDAAAEDGPMAGILLYTAAADSEGTLGGLVSLGQPRTLARHLDHALDRARLCASDPLCAEHHPTTDDLALHGAACHACLFLPETSCERGNRYLDRRALVSTVEGNPGAYFNS